MIDIESELKKNEDSKYKEFHKKITCDLDVKYGVRVPVLRRIAKDICKEDWKEFLSQKATCQEWTIIKAIVVAQADMSVEERLRLTELFIPEIDNWAICDIFCSSWKVKKSDKEKLWEYSLKQLDTNDEFRMRVGTVMILSHFIDENHIDTILEKSISNYHPGYYYRMGVAWTLSVCYVKFLEKTEIALFSNSLDQDIRNKAIQKISDSLRVDKTDKIRLKQKNKK